MSSTVKRRKVDSDVPSGLLKKKDKKEKKLKVKAQPEEADEEDEEQVAPRSQSPDSKQQKDGPAEVEEEAVAEEAPKTFKGLVSAIHCSQTL
jgi:hypothetical protein